MGADEVQPSDPKGSDSHGPGIFFSLPKGAKHFLNKLVGLTVDLPKKISH